MRSGSTAQGTISSLLGQNLMEDNNFKKNVKRKRKVSGCLPPPEITAPWWVEVGAPVEDPPPQLDLPLSP